MGEPGPIDRMRCGSCGLGVLVAANGPPGLPRDAQDHECDRDADERVSDLEAERDDGSAGYDGERDVGVGAGAVCDQGALTSRLVGAPDAILTRLRRR